MKKTVTIAFSALLLGTTPAVAWASPQSGHGRGSHESGLLHTVSENNVQTDTTVTSTETSQSYERTHGLRGLENALKHVTNPRAAAVLQALIDGQNPSTVTQQVYGTQSESTQNTVTQQVYGTGQNDIQDSDIDQILTSLEGDNEDSREEKKKAFDALVQLLEQNGNLEQAIQAAQGSVANNPKDDTAFQRLADLYNKKGDKELKIYINGKELKYEFKPFIKNGRTLVPLRAIAEALGATVSWDGTTGTVTITKDGTTVTLPLGGNQASVNGKVVVLEVPANSYNGRTFVPARFVSECLGSLVKWVPQSEGGIVNIQSTTDTTTSTNSASDSTATATDTTTSTNS